MTKSAIIIGASRGLGLGLASEFANRGWDVVATARDPGTATALAAAAAAGGFAMLPVDIDDDDSVAALDSALGDRRFDLIFVNAGIYGPRHNSVVEVNHDEIAALMWTNAIAPLRLATRFLPRVRDGGTLAFMTSILGSVALGEAGGMDLYRASKASLNIMSRSFVANVVKDRPIAVLNLHPGWVKTDMGTSAAPLEIAESVAGLADVVESSTAPGHRYLDYTGATLPW